MILIIPYPMVLCLSIWQRNRAPHRKDTMVYVYMLVSKKKIPFTIKKLMRIECVQWFPRAMQYSKGCLFAEGMLQSLVLL